MLNNCEVSYYAKGFMDSALGSWGHLLAKGSDFFTLQLNPILPGVPFLYPPPPLKTVASIDILNENISFFKVNWLNDYHALVLEKVGGYLKDRGKTKVVDWLSKETTILG